MDKRKKEMLERLRVVKAEEEKELEKVGLKDRVNIKRVQYLSDIQIYRTVIDEDTGEHKKSEELDTLCIVSVEEINKETGNIVMKYYSGDMLLGTEAKGVGQNEPAIIPSPEYLRMYEEDKPIKDLVADLKEILREKEEKKAQEKSDKEDGIERGLKGITLEELEQEKKKEELEKKEKVVAGNEQEEVRQRARGYIQVIDVDQVKVDDVRTFREAYNIPEDVKKIGFKYPVTDEQRVISDDLSFDMIDADDYSIDVTRDGKRREDLFIVDDATGDNPMYDDVTHVNINKTVDRDSNSTLKRFKAVNPAPEVKNNGLSYISVRQKEIGGHVKVYADGKDMDGNDVEGHEFETTVTKIHTDNDMEKVFNNKNGRYNLREIDQEVKTHGLKGEETTSHKNADGKANTMELCDRPEICGTDPEITWEELSERTGEGIEKLKARYKKEWDGKRTPNDIVEAIQSDYEMLQSHNHNL